jgi:hypothetical protein
MQPLWRYFLRYLSRPVLAPGFAVLFLCFASLSLYQGWVIQQFKKPQAMATTSLKEARRGDDATVVTARRNSVFPLHFLFSSSTEYDSYEGQISLDMGDNSASSTNPDKGKAPLKAFPISGRDAQEPITVNLYSGDLHEGDYVLEVLGVKEGNSKVSIATYYFKLRLQK